MTSKSKAAPAPKAPTPGLDPNANPALGQDDADAEVAAAAEVQAKIDEAVAAAVAATLASKQAEIDEAVATALANQAPVEAAPPPLPAEAKRIRIILEESDDIPPTGLFLGVNGRSYMIRPGEEVDVPEEVIHCLNDAVGSTPRTDQQGNVVDYRNKLRFPYRILSSEL